MTANVCWDCIKGRHLICEPDEDGPCHCPVPHEPVCSRRPIFDQATAEYVDLGADDPHTPCINPDHNLVMAMDKLARLGPTRVTIIHDERFQG